VSFSLETAWDIIKNETTRLRLRHRKFYETYHEHKKALKALIESEPEKPLLIGIKKWKQDYARWSGKKDALTKAITEDFSALGCVIDFQKEPERAEKEVERLQDTYKDRTLREATTLHPEAAKVVQAEMARKEKEEREAKEAKEAAERQEKALYREAKYLMRKSGMNESLYVFDAWTDGRRYSGEIIGIIPWEGKSVAVQKLGPDMAVLHRFQTLPEDVAVGAKLTLVHDRDDNISIVTGQEKARSVYMGR
jgi:hypothetical protein